MLLRVYPPLADDTGTGNGTEERGVTGGEPALAEATTRATLAETRLSDFKSMLDDIREQRDRPITGIAGAAPPLSTATTPPPAGPGAQPRQRLDDQGESGASDRCQDGYRASPDGPSCARPPIGESATTYDLHHARNGQADWWTAPLQNACSSDYPALETDE
jgi:hypothetical protein